jgi:5'-nucleotidase
MFKRGNFTPEAGTDIEAIAAKKISLTPLRLDLTDGEARRLYAKAFA